MTKKPSFSGALALGFLILAGLVMGGLFLKRIGGPPKEDAAPMAAEEALTLHPGCLFGRVSTLDGSTYEGRLRFGGDEEAFWGHTFNGMKNDNPWAAHIPIEQLKERRPFKILGFKAGTREREVNLRRPFMTRLGDIARIDADGRKLAVTAKSGTVFHLDRSASDDLADGVRVWARSGIVDIHERQIRSIEFLPVPLLDPATNRLHGTVHTKNGSFTGFLQWNREESVRSGSIEGHTDSGVLRLSFDNIQAITRKSGNSSLLTMVDGRDLVLSGTPDVGEGNRGIYVDDQRYGRVLISWAAFQRVNFSFGGSGPAYGDFPPGRPLTGSVITQDGRRLTGRLVYDLDESETTETLDAPCEGVDYTILFGLIASIGLPPSRETGDERATVTLHGGDQLELELAGDLGSSNGGMLIFTAGIEQPDYVRWTAIQRIDFDRLPIMPGVGL